MDILMSLVVRHNKVFLRNRMLVFFSLFSVIISITLYVVFLQKMQLDAIERVVPVSDAIKILVNEWMFAGLLTIIAVTTTLGVFGMYIKDFETKLFADFLTTAASRLKIQFSYVISALFIGFAMSLVALIICEIFIVFTGGNLLSLQATLKVVGILFLSVLLSSTINLFIVLFIKTQSSFSTVSTIIGSAIGFLCGIYVPMSSLPSYVQSIIHYFPISHIAVLLRESFMADSINEVFQGNADAADSYKTTFGVMYEINGSIVSNTTSVLFICGTIVILGFVSFYIFTRKHK